MIPDVLIIGAGLAGVKLAYELHNARRTSLLVEKSRGVGGRAATRRWDGVPVDHGAQFFTVREGDFQGMTNRWRAHRVCFPWAQGFHQWDDDGLGLRPPDPGEEPHPRYACREGMSALAKNLAGVLPRSAIRLESRVTAVHWMRDHWQAEVEGPAQLRPTGRRLVLSMPVPQALALLGTPEQLDRSPLLRADCLELLRSVQTAPTLAVLLRGPAAAPEWQGVQLRDGTLSWIGHDSDKRIPDPAAPDAPPVASDEDRVFVLHGSEDFSREWQDGDLDEAARRMVARAGEIVGDWITHLPRRQVHRWRYARVPQGLEDVSALRGTGVLGAPLYFTGDAFLGGKIEGACRSGLILARELLEDMRKTEARPKMAMPFPFDH